MRPSKWSLPRRTTAENRETVAIEPLSTYRKNPRGGLACDPALDGRRGVPAPLDGDLGLPRQVIESCQVTDDVHLRVAGQCEIREHRHAAGAVHLRAGLLGEHPAEWAGLHTDGPDRGGGWNALNVAVGVLDVDTVGVHVGDRRAQLHLHTDLAQPPAGQAAELFAEGRQHRGPASTSTTRAVAGSRLRKSRRSVRRASSAI